jgi:hypothetical protein
MAQVERVTLGVLPRHSIPDPITFTFKNSQGGDRDLTGYDFKVIIQKPDGTVITDRTGEADGDPTEGRAKYYFQDGDLDEPNIEVTGTKIQMIAEKTNGNGLRRHISDIAVINVDNTPASAEFEEA